MRLLVTGRGGQVARSLVEQASAHAIDVTCLGRPDIDLEAPEGLAQAIVARQPNIIVSAAAYTAVDKAEVETDLAHRVNAIGPRAIAEAARTLDVPIIHLSTDYVFDGRKVGRYAESDATNPLSVYGVTKLEGERMVVSTTPNHVILRVAWLYSPFGHNFAQTMLRLARTRSEIRVVDDQYGTPTSTLDLADAILRLGSALVSDPDAPRGLFHFAPSGSASWAEFAEAIFAASAKVEGPFAKVIAIRSADYPTPAPRPMNSRLDAGKIASAYGIDGRDWHEAVDDVVARLVRERQKDTIL